MAEARQKEMKVNITVVATKTLIAGLEPSTDVAMLRGRATTYQGKPIEDSIGGVRGRGQWQRNSSTLQSARSLGNVHGLLSRSMSLWSTVLISVFPFREPDSPLWNSIQPSLKPSSI